MSATSPQPTDPTPTDSSPVETVPASTHQPASRGRRTLLWFLAVFLMFAAYAYQKRTGPTYPLRGAIETGGQRYKYKLIRSEETVRDARVILPAAEGVSATLVYRRYKTDDPFTSIPFAAESIDEEPKLVADLPRQPAAGKLEYHVDVDTPEGTTRIPESADEEIIIRFKDPVPMTILLPHIIMMFFSILIGMRAGLAALFDPAGMRRWAWISLIGMTFGGMVLGPVVQKYAFGEYWTGFPWGYDLTDNKMLIMWVSWLLACSIIGFRPRPKEGFGRAAVVAAALVMSAVYMIPHSMRGSELDYSKLDQGVPAAEAIGTGD